MPIWAIYILRIQILIVTKRGRPKCVRTVEGIPAIDYFKPRGIPLMNLEAVHLTVEELEAIRLVDFEDLEQEQAATEMNVSRRTLARELKSGRKKIADALLHGKAIEIKGGDFISLEKRIFLCEDCGHEWEEKHGTGRPEKCKKCGSNNIHRIDAGPRTGRGRGPSAEGRGRGPRWA